MKRKALGKGLRSLIPEAPPTAAKLPEASAAAEAAMASKKDGLRSLDIDRISPNSQQPRQDFDDEALAELAESMKSHGVLQPVVVRPRDDGGYELIAGERRWRAAQLAGLLKLPALVRDVQDDELLELALVENIQREELNPIETAVAYQTLINDLGLTQAEAAERVGKQRTTVTNALRLLNLTSHVQDMVREGKLAAGHARALAGVMDKVRQIELAEKIAREELSVRQAEGLISKAPAKKTKTAGEEPAPERDPNIVAAEDRLSSALSTRVKIHQGKKAGRIELHFFSQDEMERVYQILLQASRTAR